MIVTCARRRNIYSTNINLNCDTNVNALKQQKHLCLQTLRSHQMEILQAMDVHVATKTIQLLTILKSFILLFGHHILLPISYSKNKYIIKFTCHILLLLLLIFICCYNRLIYIYLKCYLK